MLEITIRLFKRLCFRSIKATSVNLSMLPIFIEFQYIYGGGVSMSCVYLQILRYDIGVRDNEGTFNKLKWRNVLV